MYLSASLFRSMKHFLPMTPKESATVVFLFCGFDSVVVPIECYETIEINHVTLFLFAVLKQKLFFRSLITHFSF